MAGKNKAPAVDSRVKPPLGSGANHAPEPDRRSITRFDSLGFGRIYSDSPSLHEDFNPQSAIRNSPCFTRIPPLIRLDHAPSLSHIPEPSEVSALATFTLIRSDSPGFTLAPPEFQSAESPRTGAVSTDSTPRACRRPRSCRGADGRPGKGASQSAIRNLQSAIHLDSLGSTLIPRSDVTDSSQPLQPLLNRPTKPSPTTAPLLLRLFAAIPIRQFGWIRSDSVGFTPPQSERASSDLSGLSPLRHGPLPKRRVQYPFSGLATFTRIHCRPSAWEHALIRSAIRNPRSAIHNPRLARASIPSYLFSPLNPPT